MLSVELKIRNVNPDDLETIQQIFVDTISVICAKDYSKEQIRVWCSSIKNLSRWLDMIVCQYCFLAEIDDKIVGLGTLDRKRKTSLSSEVSKTARLFFENKGFVVIAEQVKTIHGVEISNYKMTKELQEPLIGK